MALDYVSNEELIREARRRLPQGAWDYLVGGSESETTLRRNRQAMETVAFRPRLLRGIARADIRTTLLGHEVESPVLLGPVGTIELFSEKVIPVFKTGKEMRARLNEAKPKGEAKAARTG